MAYRHKRLVSYWRRAIRVSIGLLVLTAAIGLLLWYKQGDRLLDVQTGSMVPTFRAGDELMVRPIPFRDLRVGEIVSYRSARDAHFIVSHRVRYINRRQDLFMTRGDHLRSDDSPVSATQLTGQVTAIMPGLGRVLAWLQKPLGLIVAVYAPLALLAIVELRRLTAHYTTSHYSLYGRDTMGL